MLETNAKKARSTVEHVIYEFFGNGNLSLYEQLVAKDVKCHCPQSWQTIHKTELNNRVSAKKIDQEYAAAFQFKKVEIEDLVTDQNKILARWSCTGLHKGNFFDIAATQRFFHLTGQTLYSFNQQDQIGEVWQSWDMLGLLGQIKDLEPPLDGLKDRNKCSKQIALLSQKERQCMQYLLQGKTAKETAVQLKLSFRTVEYYFENIKNKLNCSRKRDLYIYARMFEKEHVF